MPFLIGTDEAGYGPNLGPLTVTGTLWKAENEHCNLYSELATAVSSDPDPEKIFIADSKRVYKPSGSVAGLECNVLALLHALHGRIPSDWKELVPMLCPASSRTHLADQVWLASSELTLPVKADVGKIQTRAEMFLDACRKANVELMSIECVPVFAPQFNSEVERVGNKATLLSTETLKIVRRQMDLTDDDLEIGCDKHGGRSKYAGLIQDIITDEFVMVGIESLESSDYSFRESDRDVVMRFQAKGESFLPTALASMVSKYLREIFMILWNEFWQAKVPGIKPTKGYPVDAKRFKSEIEKAQAELGIGDHLIWRNR